MSECSYADILKRLDVLEETLEPIINTWQDVAVLGRYTRIVFRSILWMASMVIALLAAWTALKGV